MLKQQGTITICVMMTSWCENACQITASCDESTPIGAREAGISYFRWYMYQPENVAVEAVEWLVI